MGNFSQPDDHDRIEMERDLLVETGVDKEAADRLLYGVPDAAPTPRGPQGRVSLHDKARLQAMRAGIQARSDMQAEGLADDVDEDTTSKLAELAGIGAGVMESMLRVNGFWRDTNSDNLTHFVQNVRDEISDIGVIGEGLANPLIRSQQALFSWLSGEGGWDKIVDDLFNPMTINMKTGEYYIGSQAFSSIAALTEKIARMDDAEYTIEETEEMNRLYRDNRIQTFMEVVDAWKGGATPFTPDPTGEKAEAGAIAMDEVYQNLNDSGLMGKMGMAVLSGLYAGGEVFVDPTFIMADAPVLGVKLARAALPASVQAARTSAHLARQRTLVHAMDALESSARYMDDMLAANKVNPTQASLNDLRKAAYQHAQNLAFKESRKDPGQFSKITFAGGRKRAPESLSLTKTNTYLEEFALLSPTRAMTPAARKARLLAEVQSKVDDLVSRQGVVGRMGPEAKKTYKKLDKLRKKIRKSDPDNLDDLIRVEGFEEVQRTVGSLAVDPILADELAAQRLRALREELPPVYDHSTIEMPLEDVASRALSQDAGEGAGDALKVLVRGGTPDDVVGQPITLPTDHLIVKDEMIGVTSDGLIDLAKAQKTINKWNAKVAKKRGQGKLDLKYDTGALPATNTPERIRDAVMDLRANAPDILAAGLYPGSYRWKAPGFLKAAWYQMRPPQSTMRAVDPGAWDVWRNALQGYEVEMTRLQNKFHREMTRFGALAPQADDPLIKGAAIELNISGPKVNQKLSEKGFALLNNPEDSEYFALLSSLTSDEQKTAIINLRAILDEMSDVQGITGTDKSIAGYVHHVLDRKNMSKGAITPEMQGLSPQGKVFVAHLLDRTGNAEFRPDMVSALDVYTRASAKKLWIEPALMQLKQRAKDISKQKGSNWYMQWMDDFINDVNHQPSFAGHLADRFLGGVLGAVNVNYKAGSLSRLLANVAGMSYVSALAMNMKYPIMAIATALNTTGASKGIFRSAKGLFSTATPAGQLLVKQAGIDKQFSKIFDQTGIAARAIKKMAAVRAGVPSVNDTEALIRGMTVQAALDETATKMGYTNVGELMDSQYKNRAIFEAIRATEETNHYFGLGSRPPIFAKISRSGARIATLFQSFGPKQTEQVLRLTTENPGYIMRYMMLGGWLQRVAGEELGVDLSEYVGLGYRPTGTDDVTSPGSDALAAWFRWSAALTNTMFDGGDPNEFHKRTKELGKALESVVPFRVAMQQRARGIEAVSTGERRTESGALTRNLEMGPGNVPGQMQDIMETFRTRKGERSELVANLVGMSSLQQRAGREATERVRSMARDQVFEELSLARAAVNAFHDDDFEEYDVKVQSLIDRGFNISDASTAIERDVEAGVLEGFLRELMENPKLIEKIIEIRIASGQLPIGTVSDEVVK